MTRMLLTALALSLAAIASAAELQPVDDAGLDAALSRPGPVFLEISQTWCAPCRAAAAALHDLMPSRPDARFLTLDAGRSARFGNLPTPTFILYSDGREVTRETGYHGPQALSALIARLPRAQAARRPSTQASELAARFTGMQADPTGPILAKLERDGYLNRYTVGRPPVAVDRDPVAIIETADGPPLLYAPAGVAADGRRLPEQFYKLVDDGQAGSMEVRALALMDDGSAYTATSSYRARRTDAPIGANVGRTLADPFAGRQEPNATAPSASNRAPISQAVRDQMAARLPAMTLPRFWRDPRSGGAFEVTDPPRAYDTRPWRSARQTMRPDVAADYGVTPDGKPVMRVARETWVRIPDAQALYLDSSNRLWDKKGKLIGRFTPGSADSGGSLFRGWGTIQGEDGRQYFYYSSGDMEDMESGFARETLIVKGAPPRG